MLIYVEPIDVFCQAAIIAFTSEFVPKLVYRYGYGNSGSLDGYVDFSLSVFAVQDLEPKSVPREPKIANVTECRYVHVCNWYIFLCVCVLFSVF